MVRVVSSLALVVALALIGSEWSTAQVNTIMTTPATIVRRANVEMYELTYLVGDTYSMHRGRSYFLELEVVDGNGQKVAAEWARFKVTRPDGQEATVEGVWDHARGYVAQLGALSRDGVSVATELQIGGRTLNHSFEMYPP